MSEREIQKKLLDSHGVALNKRLGQNFIINEGICPKIAQCLPEGCFAVEIGPGAGALTQSLLQRCGEVCAVELDERMLPVLRERFADAANVSIVHADAMKLDFAQLIAQRANGRPVCIAGNLPYYITSPLIMRLLESRLAVDKMVFMVQKEAAQRLCAAECTRDAGAITLAVRYYSRPKIEFYVSRGSFYPAPKVDSAVISLEICPPPEMSPEHASRMFALIKAAFSQRRKTAVNSVANLTGLEKAQVAQAVSAVGIDENARAEDISLAQYAELALRL